ncbi:MAG: hypothetical protein SchgKO_11110 [Schleiferiaceae bacterium]
MRKSLCFLILIVGIAFQSLAQEGPPNERLPLSFTEIRGIDFQEFKEAHDGGLEYDSSKVVIPDSAFYLEVEEEVVAFPCEQGYFDCQYYRGYSVPLNCYVITHCGSSVCYTYLVNKTTGEKQNLFGPYDNENMAPVFSPDRSQFIVWVSDVFDVESSIALYDLDPTAEVLVKAANWETPAVYNTYNWRIAELLFVDSKTIVIKTYENYGGKNGNELLNVKYWKGVFK